MHIWESVRAYIIDHTIKIGSFLLISILVFWILFYPIFNDVLYFHLPTIIIVHLSVTVVIGFLLLDYFNDIRKHLKPPEIRIHDNQDSVNPLIGNYIHRNKPKWADLLEFSGNTVFQTIIKPLTNVNSSIRLILQNPNMVEEQLKLTLGDKERICDCFAKVIGIEIQPYPKIKIRFNNQVASLRGRKFDNGLVNIGWYTYDLRPKDVNIDQYPTQVHGHDNPLLSFSSGADKYNSINKMFSKIFTDYWNRGAKPIDANHHLYYPESWAY